MAKLDCTFLILTYKGIHHLEYLLPTVQGAIQNTPNFPINVLIVDNGCDEKTREYCTNHFPEFEFRFSPINDYLFSLNSFVRNIESEFTFILNDDMKLHPEVLNQTLPLISKDKSLFGVTCNIQDWDGTYKTIGIRSLAFNKGWGKILDNHTNVSDHTYTWFAGGGAAVFRTDMFNQLGGFDPLFRPAYAEDSDLCWRAWRKGWKIIENRLAILYHREGGTIKDQQKADILEQQIISNKVILFLKNTDYPYFKVWFVLLLPFRLLYMRRIHKNSWKGLVQALPRISKALFQQKTEKVLSDKEILNYIGKPYPLQN